MSRICLLNYLLKNCCTEPLFSYNTDVDTISEKDIDISESAPTPEISLLLKDPDKDQDRIIAVYQRGGSWTAAAKLLGRSKRALLEQRKRHGINKYDLYKN